MPHALMKSTQKGVLALVLTISDDVPSLVAAWKAQQGALNALELEAPWDDALHSVKVLSCTVDPSHAFAQDARLFGDRLAGAVEQALGTKKEPWEGPDAPPSVG